MLLRSRSRVRARECVWRNEGIGEESRVMVGGVRGTVKGVGGRVGVRVAVAWGDGEGMSFEE